MSPTRILLVDCDSVRAAERVKASRLAAIADTEVHLLVPNAYTVAGKRLAFEPGPAEGFDMTVGRLVGHPPARTLFATGLSRALRDRPPHVVHVTSDENFFLTSQVARATKRLAPNALFTFHSWGNILFSRARHPQWIPFLYEFDTHLERGVFRSAPGAAVRNREAARVLRARGFRGRIAYIPWGTDAERMGSGNREAGRRRFSLPDSEFVVGFLGRLVEEKGLLDLERACRDHPSRPLLAVAGDGPLREALADRGGSAVPGARRVRLLGNLDDGDLPDFLAALDVLVLPSRTTPFWKEQFGRALVEAMAAGTAVIGSDSGAIPEVIGDAGLVVAEGNAGSLAEAIETLARDSALRGRLARAGRDRARREFSWEAFAARSAAFLRALRGEPAAPDAFEEMP